MTIQAVIKSGCRQVIKRCYIKRYNGGLFESSWYNITQYVVSWGSPSEGFGDESYLGQFNIPSWYMVFSNRTRKFQPESERDSLFYGYTSRDKTRFKISISYVDNSYTSGISNEYNEIASRSFYGVVLGDMQNDDSGLITVPLTSLLTIFRWFPFEGDAGTSDLTSNVIDRSVKRTESGIRIFDQYFEGATDEDKYQITAGTITLNPYLTDKTQKIIDKIWMYGIAEDYFAWITTDGNFAWKTRDCTALTQWIFNGGGSVDNDYGCNIISVVADRQGKNSLFNRIVIAYAKDIDGVLEYKSADTSWTPGDNSVVDKYGLLALDLTIMDLNGTTGQSTATAILSRYNILKREVEIITPLITHLVPADKVEINYLGELTSQNSFTLGVSLLGGSDVLGNRLGSIFIDGLIGKIIHAEHNLDECISKFIIREV